MENEPRIECGSLDEVGNRGNCNYNNDPVPEGQRDCFIHWLKTRIIKNILKKIVCHSVIRHIHPGVRQVRSRVINIHCDEIPCSGAFNFQGWAVLSTIDEETLGALI